MSVRHVLGEVGSQLAVHHVGGRGAPGPKDGSHWDDQIFHPHGGKNNSHSWSVQDSVKGGGNVIG